MVRGRAVFDLIWPSSSGEYAGVAKAFSEGVVRQMLAATWGGYDCLKGELLSHVDVASDDEELERSITQLLEPKIRAQLTGEEPYYVQHGPHEFATRAPSPAHPPVYDIAFVLNSNARVMWPLEAKVLRTDRSVASYVDGINDQFLTGRYAPLVSSAAMLGYLFSGVTSVAFASISQSLGVALVQHPEFASRPHRVSEHLRQPSYPRAVAGTFRCHHLIMKVN